MRLVTHRRHFNAASQRSHTGEPPTRHIFSSRRVAVRAHPIFQDGVRRRPPRPPHAPSGSVPLGQTGGVRAQAPVQHREPNSPQMRVLPPPQNQSRRRGVRHVWRKRTHDGRRRPLSRFRRSSLGCPSVAACGEGSGGVRFVLASGGRAKGSGGKSEPTARMRSTCVTSTPRGSCHLVIVLASLPGLRVLRLACVLVQVRGVHLVFLLVIVLFVDLVEPAPSPSRP